MIFCPVSVYCASSPASSQAGTAVRAVVMCSLTDPEESKISGDDEFVRPGSSSSSFFILSGRKTLTGGSVFLAEVPCRCVDWVEKLVQAFASARHRTPHPDSGTLPLEYDVASIVALNPSTRSTHRHRRAQELRSSHRCWVSGIPAHPFRRRCGRPGAPAGPFACRREGKHSTGPPGCRAAAVMIRGKKSFNLLTVLLP
jgi:hypothetical protein